MDDLEINWRACCEQEIKLRGEAFALASETATQGSESKEALGGALRAWWASVAELLSMSFKFAALKPPPELLEVLAGISGYIAVGQIPGPISDASSEGRRSPGPSERRDIQRAVAYLRAAQGGIDHWGGHITIPDKSPVKTVCEAFGVAKTTVQGWRRKYEPGCLGNNPVDAEIVTSLMRQAGERYRQSGRSHAANRRRGARN